MLDNRVWDYTAISLFLTCRKKFYFRVIKGLEHKRPSAPLQFGLAIHNALDIHYTKGNDEAVRVFSESYRDIEEDTLRTRENGIKLLEAYGRVYKNEPFTPVGKPEAGFVFPIGDILWGGRMDLPVEWSGELWIMEHKTTTGLRNSYFSQFKLDMQITSYIMGAEECMGRKCMGCMVNALEPWKQLVRPTSKSKKEEEHFLRAPITRSSKLKATFKENIQRHVRDIKWCYENGEWAEAHLRETCFQYRSACPYENLCTFGEESGFVERDYDYSPWEPYKKEDTKEDTKEKEEEGIDGKLDQVQNSSETNDQREK